MKFIISLILTFCFYFAEGQTEITKSKSQQKDNSSATKLSSDSIAQIEQINNILNKAESHYENSMHLSEKNIEFTTTLIHWTSLVLAFAVFLIAVGAYLGFREYAQIRQTMTEIKEIKDQSKVQLDEVTKIKEETTIKLSELKNEFIAKSESFMITSFNYNIGAQAYKSGNFEEALEYFKNAYNYSPNDTHLLCRIGRSLCNLDRNWEANDFFNKALLLDSNSHEALSGLATSMRYIDLDKAISYCKQALLQKPEDVFLHDYLGLLYRDKNEIPKSYDCHLESTRINPDSSVSYFYLSMINEALGNKDEAKSTMNKTVLNVSKDKDLRPVWKQTIQVCQYLMLDDIENALNETKKLKELFKANKRTLKASIAHIEFLLEAKKLNSEKYRFHQIFGNA